MRSRRTRSSEASVTLFPFLAVLICTMGALIVLLVVVVQQARSQAESIAEGQSKAVEDRLAEQSRKRAEQVAEMQLEVDDLKWQAELLDESHSKTAEDLADERLRLSHIEQHVRQLRAELQLAAKAVQQLENKSASGDSNSAESQQKLADIRQQIAVAEEDLKATRDRIAAHPKSYAIVPYDGPNGTRRRPMYIECTSTSVILQPEGIKLSSDDFEPPMGPGNPLAVALRAKREYWAAHGLSEDSEPYPLLIVRPGGAEAYAASRSAMTAWDSEFGYELISDNLNLDFSTSTDELAQILQQVVDEARDRQSALRQIAARRSRSNSMAEGTLIPSRSGGFEVVGGRGSGIGGGGFGGTNSDSDGGGFGGTNSDSDGGGSGEFGDSSSETRDSAGGSRSSSESRNPSDGFAGFGDDNSQSRDFADGSSGFGDGSGGFGDDGAASDRLAGSRGGGGGNNRANSKAGPGGSSDNGSDFNNNTTTGPAGSGGNASMPMAGATDRPSLGSQPSDGATGNATGATTQRNANQLGAAGINASGQAQGQARAMRGQIPPQQLAAEGTTQSNPTSVATLARTRGSNWALPRHTQSSTAIRRPVQVVLSQDQITLVPEKGSNERVQSFGLDHELRAEIDEVVAVIWKRIRDWGIAGTGVYWQPVLHVDVKDRAEWRFAELTQLLENSGLQVKRKRR